MARGGRRTGGGMVGNGLFLLGCLAVLGGTFGLGALAGRWWAHPPAGTSSPPPSRPAPARADRLARPAESTPALTFYHELTAPLTSPPAAPGRPSRSPRAERPATEARPELPASETPPAAAGQRFTVQVGAYRAREPAETLKASLRAAGWDAYIVEREAPGGPRFRVRIGAYVSREAAQQAAAKLGSERALIGFVTTR